MKKFSQPALLAMALSSILLSSPAGAQLKNLHLYRICENPFFKLLRSSLEKCAPGSHCAEFAGICELPDQEIGLEFWRGQWTKAFQAGHFSEASFSASPVWIMKLRSSPSGPNRMI